MGKDPICGMDNDEVIVAREIKNLPRNVQMNLSHVAWRLYVYYRCQQTR